MDREVDTSRMSRTFKPRRRRLGSRRASLHAELLPRFGLDESGPSIDLRALFEPGSTVCLEIGSGNGDLASYMTRNFPRICVVAVDVHRPGIARLLDDIDSYSLVNARVVEGDALIFVERLMTSSLDEVWAFFPDPWPKNAQAHRRLFTTERIVRLARVLREGGVLRVATDVDSYAISIDRKLRESGLFEELCADRPEWRIETAFERAGREAGRSSTDLTFVRNGVAVNS
ncbi:MAG: tRNA (guanine(46)-N(7))-methyltransferase TrmB [Ilumatobacteraceae bacterium]